MTSDEKYQLKKEIIEELLSSMPDLMGNLMTEYAENRKLKKEFYSKHPEFSDHRDVVQEVVQRIEGEKLGQSYSEILEKSVSDIREQIRLKSSADMTSIKGVKEVSRALNPDDNNGEL